MKLLYPSTAASAESGLRAPGDAFREPPVTTKQDLTVDAQR